MQRMLASTAVAVYLSLAPAAMAAPTPTTRAVASQPAAGHHLAKRHVTGHATRHGAKQAARQASKRATRHTTRRTARHTRRHGKQQWRGHGFLPGYRPPEVIESEREIRDFRRGRFYALPWPRFYRGRWNGGGFGPCYTWTPIGPIWNCGP
jgi:hypothetical protein